jgi:hypothetical protein
MSALQYTKAKLFDPLGIIDVARMVLAKPRGDWAEAGQSLAHGLGILDALEEKNSPSALQKQIRTWLEDLRESA